MLTADLLVGADYAVHEAGDPEGRVSRVRILGIVSPWVVQRPADRGAHRYGRRAITHPNGIQVRRLTDDGATTRLEDETILPRSIRAPWAAVERERDQRRREQEQQCDRRHRLRTAATEAGEVIARFTGATATVTQNGGIWLCAEGAQRLAGTLEGLARDAVAETREVDHAV